MSLVATAPENDGFELAPEGTHIARCVQLIEVGTIYSEYYKTWSAKVLIGWELPNTVERKDDEGNELPFMVFRRYTKSLGDKAELRKHLRAWRTRDFTPDELRGFDLGNILDKPCMINVSHDERDGKTYANVSSVMALPQGTAVPDRMTKLAKFEIANWNDELFADFSEKFQATIKSSKEYAAIQKRAAEGGNETVASEGALPDDDIPF